MAVKELVDNSIDACEEAGITPEISITVDADSISVSDNGPGLSAETIRVRPAYCRVLGYEPSLTSDAVDNDKINSPVVSATASPVEAAVDPASGQGPGWPPRVNALGMIGQEEIARELDNQARKAKGWGERFLDKLFVGPAGVGKTTLARRIADCRWLASAIPVVRVALANKMARIVWALLAKGTAKRGAGNDHGRERPAVPAAA